MESVLYVKSMMMYLLIIICSAVFSDHILPVENVIGIKVNDNNSGGCDSSLTTDYHVAYHRLNQTLSISGMVNLTDSSVNLKPSVILPSSILTTRDRKSTRLNSSHTDISR